MLWEQDVAGSNPVIPNIVLRLYGSKAVRFWQRDSVELQAFEAEQLCCEAGPKGNPVIPNIVLRLYGSKAVRFWQRDSVELQAFEAEQLCCEAGPERNPFLITDS